MSLGLKEGRGHGDPYLTSNTFAKFHAALLYTLSKKNISSRNHLQSRPVERGLEALLQHQIKNSLGGDGRP